MVFYALVLQFYFTNGTKEDDTFLSKNTEEET